MWNVLVKRKLRGPSVLNPSKNAFEFCGKYRPPTGSHCSFVRREHVWHPVARWKLSFVASSVNTTTCSWKGCSSTNEPSYRQQENHWLWFPLWPVYLTFIGWSLSLALHNLSKEEMILHQILGHNLALHRGFVYGVLSSLQTTQSVSIFVRHIHSQERFS